MNRRFFSWQCHTSHLFELLFNLNTFHSLGGGFPLHRTYMCELDFYTLYRLLMHADGQPITHTLLNTQRFKFSLMSHHVEWWLLLQFLRSTVPYFQGTRLLWYTDNYWPVAIMYHPKKAATSLTSLCKLSQNFILVCYTLLYKQAAMSYS